MVPVLHEPARWRRRSGARCDAGNGTSISLAPQSVQGPEHSAHVVDGNRAERGARTATNASWRIVGRIGSRGGSVDWCELSDHESPADGAAIGHAGFAPRAARSTERGNRASVLSGAER